MLFLIISVYCWPVRPSDGVDGSIPLVLTTWGHPGFQVATKEGFAQLLASNSRLDALVKTLSTCEQLQCDGTVGFGGSPDELGETRLDALIFDGPGHKVGAVASMADVKNAAQVALAVLSHTKHSMLVGDGATKFALEMGFRAESLQTNKSQAAFAGWKLNSCQPNYRKNVIPDPTTSCGPYEPANIYSQRSPHRPTIDWNTHDTIGTIVIDFDGNVAAGTSTNGATHKVHGRVGDSPIPGAGAYVDNDVGAAASTGDGDILMRFAPSYQAVEYMRAGRSPEKAAAIVLSKIAQIYPNFSGALITATKNGTHGAACHGFGNFQFSICSRNHEDVHVYTIRCT